MIAGICGEPAVLEIMRIVNIIFGLLKIAVPLILIVLIMVKIGKAIVSGEADEISGAIKDSMSKFIAAVLVFFVPTIVVAIFNMAFPNSEFLNCLNVKTKDDISAIYENRAVESISKAETSLDIKDYDAAYSFLSKIKDEQKKEAYMQRLSAVQEKIYITFAEAYVKIVEESLDEGDYLVANNYLNNLSDGVIKNNYIKRLAVVKKIIDEEKRKKLLANSGAGKDIVPTNELITACYWIINQEKVNIRLYTCTKEAHRYPNPDAELPGGAIELSAGNAKAKNTITLLEYQKGVFFGEQKASVSPESRKAFMIMYRTVFIHNTVHYAIRSNRDPVAGAEISYEAGSCTQNHRMTRRKEVYESGKYKTEIDETVEATKYLVLADTDGNTTDARYHSYTGIEQQVEKAGKEGTNFVEILESVIKSGNDDASYYKNARVYDCRNLVENGTIAMDQTQ